MQVSPSYSKVPDEEYTIVINFGVDPARIEELTKVVFLEIEKLKTEGSTAEAGDMNVKLDGREIGRHRKGSSSSSLFPFSFVS